MILQCWLRLIQGGLSDPRHGHDLPSHSSMSCQHRHRLVTVLHHLDIPCRDSSNKRTSLCNFLVMSSACFATRGRVTLFLRYMIEVIILLRHLCTLDVTFALAKPLVYCKNIVYQLSAHLFATSVSTLGFFWISDYSISLMAVVHLAQDISPRFIWS